MIPVEQTVMGQSGNCEAACIASILECPIEDVPSKEADEEWPSYYSRINTFLRRFYGLHCIYFPADDDFKPGGWSIGSVQSDLSDDLHHAVVCYCGEPRHDPLGRADVLSRPILGYSVFVAWNPADAAFQRWLRSKRPKLRGEKGANQ